jgi:hypothetical protein
MATVSGFNNTLLGFGIGATPAGNRKWVPSSQSAKDMYALAILVANGSVPAGSYPWFSEGFVPYGRANWNQTFSSLEQYFAHDAVVLFDENSSASWAVANRNAAKPDIEKWVAAGRPGANSPAIIDPNSFVAANPGIKGTAIGASGPGLNLGGLLGGGLIGGNSNPQQQGAFGTQQAGLLGNTPMAMQILLAVAVLAGIWFFALRKK